MAGQLVLELGNSFALCLGGHRHLHLLRASGTLRWLLPLAVGLGLVAFALARRDFRRFDNLLAGGAIGGVIVALWFVTGHLGHVAEHPVTLDEMYLGTHTGRMEALSFVAPVAYTLDWLMFFSDASRVLVLADSAKTNSFGLLDPQSTMPDPERYDGKAAGLLLDGSGRAFSIEGDLKPTSVWFRNPDDDR